MTLDATAAYPNHMGHSVCLRNSISFPCLDRRPPPPLGLPQTLGCGDQRGSTNTASIDRDKCHFAQGPRLKIVYFLMPAFPVSFGNEYPGGQRVDRRDAGPLIEAPGIALSLNNFTFAPNEPINVTIIPDSRTQGDFRNTSDNTRRKRGEQKIRALSGTASCLPWASYQGDSFNAFRAGRSGRLPRNIHRITRDLATNRCRLRDKQGVHGTTA